MAGRAATRNGMLSSTTVWKHRGGGGVERGDTEAELYTYRVPDDVNNFYHGSVVLLLR
jgi:hypothetical protein